MRITILIGSAAAIALIAACASPSGSSARPNDTAAPRTSEDVDLSADAGNGRISPLGLGQPDPERMFERALAAHENGDFWAFMSYFAFIDDKGEYFVPRESEDEDRDQRQQLPDQRATRALAQSLRNFIASDWVEVTYGRPRNVRDDPVTAAVPMTISYDFDVLTPERKQRILDEFNLMLELQGVERPLTWEEYRSRLLNGPRTAERRFVNVDGAWRFDAGWRLE